jgi:hypothetical protein
VYRCRVVCARFHVYIYRGIGAVHISSSSSKKGYTHMKKCRAAHHMHRQMNIPLLCAESRANSYTTAQAKQQQQQMYM